MDISYAGMVSCYNVKVEEGATNHMTGSLQLITEVSKPSQVMRIRLPTGETPEIAHVGAVMLCNGIKLRGEHLNII